MANYYTHFSFLVTVEGDWAWVDELWPLLDSADDGPVTEHPIFGSDDVFGVPLVESDDGGLWFHDDAGCSDIDTTIAVVQWVLTHPGTPATVEFQWADTCAKPRLDAYSGGAALVSRDAAATVHTSSTSITELLAADLADQHTADH